jgi:hypothetical protein
VALLLVGAVAGVGCSSGGGSAGQKIPADVAAGFAARADRIAAELDAGACDQALTEARSLQTDIAGMRWTPTLQADALSRAARLVGAVNCPPPPAPVPPTVVVDPGFPKKGKGHGHDHEGD